MREKQTKQKVKNREKSIKCYKENKRNKFIHLEPILRNSETN